MSFKHLLFYLLTNTGAFMIFTIEGTQRHRAKRNERIKSKIGKVKKLKGYVTEEVKTVNKCCDLGHAI